MCDQDHFEEDREQFESLGLVTRKQFGMVLGAGMAMMLPRVANAAAVTESEVNVTTPDGTADCYFVHPSSGAAAGVLLWPDIFGLRPALRQMGKRLADRGRRRRDPYPGRDAARARPERDDAHDGCEGVHRVAGPASAGRQEPEDRHAGLLHGRPDRVSYGGRRA